MAAAGKKAGIPTIGFVRGEELAQKERNPTLSFCEAEGMRLYFLSREAYRKKEAAPKVKEIVMENQYTLLAEGGTNPLAVKGCEEILLPDDKGFDCVAVAVGTGGTFMGLLNTCFPQQHLLGFDVVKDQKVTEWITQEAGVHKNYTLLDVPVAGTYGNASDELIHFINAFYSQYKILLDPLYTGKLLFGIFALIKNKQWHWGKNILIIHTGGIQGIEGFNIRQKQKGKPCIVH